MPGRMKPAPIVRRSRPAKRPNVDMGTGGGFAPPAPNILANAACGNTQCGACGEPNAAGGETE
eukprot:3868305-Prymnesium_polylepis.1